jgi:hypothetical protein
LTVPAWIRPSPASVSLAIVSLAVASLATACRDEKPPAPPPASAASTTAPAPAETPKPPPAGLPATAADVPPRAVSRVEDPENAKPGDTVRVREFHENGVLATERTELVTPDGKRVRQGPMKAWHLNGELSIEGGYDAGGKLTGRWRYFDEQGLLLREGEYVEGLREGDWADYWPGTKQMRSQGFIHVGQLEGPWKYWHENGQPMSEGTYVNNKREGPWLYWKPDGKPDADQTGTYKDHVKIGP